MKAIATSILLLFSLSGVAQSPVTIVKAPTLEALSAKKTSILTTMNVTMATIERTEQKLAKLREVTAWLNRLESMQEFIQLLETTACLARDLDTDLNLALDLMGPRSSCMNLFEYKININQLRYVVDIVNVILTEGFSMNRSGRLEAYEHALSAFQRAQLGLGELATFLKRVIWRYERAKEYKEAVFAVNDFSRYR